MRLAGAKSDSLSPAVGRREGGHRPRGCGIGDCFIIVSIQNLLELKTLKGLNTQE